IRLGYDNVIHVTSAIAQDLIHGRPSIRAEMEAVRDLDRIRRTLLAALGVGTSAIADNDLDAGMAAQPIGEDLSSAVVEKVNRAMRFQIKQQGAVASLLSTQGDI